MKLSKADFLRQFGNQRVATSGLTSGSAINTDQGEKLSRADANSDGIIAGQEEMGRLFDWMAFTNRQHNPNQGFGQELELKSAPQGLWDVMIETTGGRAGQPAQPVRTTQPAQPTQPRTTTNVAPNDVTRNTNHTPTHNHRPAHSNHHTPPRTHNPTHTNATTTTTRTTATSADPARDALLKKLVLPGGSGTQADVDAVMKDVQLVSTDMLRSLDRTGVKIRAVRGSVTDHLANLRGVVPRGWEGTGKTWDDVPGLYDPSTREVVVATIPGAGGSRQVPQTGAHGSKNLTLHELVHGFDYTQGMPSVNNAEFNAARDRDLPALTAYNDYFAQPGNAGKEETYAEALAMYIEGEPILRQRFPNLYNYFHKEFGG